MEADSALDVRVVRHTATADLYSLVAFLLQTPTAENVARLQEASPADDLRAIAGELGVEGPRVEALCARLDALHARLAADEDALHGVRVEHTRLFTQPRRPAVWPYEGVFVDDERLLAGMESTEARIFINPAAGDAERTYRAAGFKMDGMREPADSIVTELEFMAKLHVLAAKAVLDGDAAATADAEEKLAAFKEKHGCAWIPRFFLRVGENSAHELYLAASEMGALLCEVDGIADKAPSAE
ncbi:MAG: molecular chaperone TorD family protein [Eggerthellaceae bacterium]|nr:molecular chaperone TorD family protein [Eggerthellaceae bacterium]